MSINRVTHQSLSMLDCFRTGFTLLGHPSLRKYVLIPILINLLLYALALVVGYLSVTHLLNQFIPTWLLWLRWLIWPLFFLSYFMAVFFTFTLVANLLCTPFYGKLSEQTLSLISGNTVVVHNLPLFQVIGSELNRWLYLFSRTVPVMLLSVIPVINVVAPIVWGLWTAWGMALEFMVYSMDNQGLNFQAQKLQLKKMRWGALSFGGITMLGLTTPLLNIVMPPVAVISATVYWYRLQSPHQ